MFNKYYITKTEKHLNTGTGISVKLASGLLALCILYSSTWAVLERDPLLPHAPDTLTHRKDEYKTYKIQGQSKQNHITCTPNFKYVGRTE